MQGIYLGTSGQILLERASSGPPVFVDLRVSDVNTSLRRWSADFPTGTFITGDRVEIKRTDGSNLELVDGHNFPDGSWYFHVDAFGGIALYDTYAAALNGAASDAKQLITPSNSQPLQLKISSNRKGIVGNITSYSLTTVRETIDTTSLGEEFRRQYDAGLMSGQGTINCLWNYKDVKTLDGSGLASEPAHYFSQLILRLKMGAAFNGEFYIVNSNSVYGVNGADEASDTNLWWQASCVVTSVGMQFSPTDPIASQIEFITTGPVTMRMGALPSYLLQENGDRILQEDGSSGILLE